MVRGCSVPAWAVKLCPGWAPLNRPPLQPWGWGRQRAWAPSWAASFDAGWSVEGAGDGFIPRALLPGLLLHHRDGSAGSQHPAGGVFGVLGGAGGVQQSLCAVGGHLPHAHHQSPPLLLLKTPVECPLTLDFLLRCHHLAAPVTFMPLIQVPASVTRVSPGC